MFETILILTVIFTSATIILVLFDKLGQPAIPAYIVAGISIGFFIDESLLIDLVQLGILFLAFIMGVRSGSEEVIKNVHFDFKSIWMQLAIVFAIAFGSAYMLGFNYLNAAFFTIAAALSSTLIGSDYRLDLKELNVVYRRISESINLMEDFVAILIILVISIIPISFLSLGVSLGYGLLIFALGFIIRFALFPWLAGLVGESSEYVMLIGLSMLIGFIGLCIYLEISIIVGAFAAGMALSKHPYEIKVLDTMGSLMDFFSVIFFVTLGALLIIPDANVIFYSLVIIVITMLVKPFVIMQLLIWQGYNKRTAVNASLQLDHVSEFALMIAIQASLVGIMEPSLFNAIILSAIVTMTLSSYTSRYSDHIYHILARLSLTNIDQREELFLQAEGEFKDHIIVVGYGVKGQKIVETLIAAEKTVLVIENDPGLISRLRQHDYNYLFGDALDSFTWKLARVDKARLVIVTAPVLQISEVALKQDTKADIMVSSYDVREAKFLLDKGAFYVNNALFLARESVEKAIRDALDGHPEVIRKKNAKILKEQQYG
ncbi:MAG: cation:proton antiporter [Balneolales bacterium]